MKIKCIIFDFYNVLYPFTAEAEKVVEYCRSKGLKLAAVSSLSPEKVDEIAKHYKIDTVLASWNFGLHKTQPEIYQRLLGRLELKGCECLMVDDEQIRLSAAKSCGINTVWLKLVEGDKLETTDCVISELGELSELAN